MTSLKPSILGFFAATAMLSLFLGLGCSGPRLAQPRAYDYFVKPDPDDVWSPKIEGWQRRERAEEPDPETGLWPVSEAADPGLAEVHPAPAPVAGADARRSATNPIESGLRASYFDFRTERKRQLARDVAHWIQTEARSHYVPDGPIDHWATLEETLSSNGDDCDGLELLAFHALRDLGFDAREVYRAIVFRPSDGQHHMVTLWFEDRDDPWVIDPTGAMTRGMPKMSELPDWVPLKVFSDRVEYTVRLQTPDQRLPSARLAVNE